METERMIAAKQAFKELSLDEQTEFIGDTLENYFNSFCSERKKLLADEIMKHHPTVQQVEMGFVVELLKRVANNKYADGRNQASQRLARKLMDAVIEQDLWLPMI